MKGASVTDDSPASGDLQIESRLNTDVAHTARVWNYWLGGKDHFAADRQIAGSRTADELAAAVEVARVLDADVRAVPAYAGFNARSAEVLR